MRVRAMEGPAMWSCGQRLGKNLPLAATMLLLGAANANAQTALENSSFAAPRVTSPARATIESLPAPPPQPSGLAVPVRYERPVATLDNSQPQFGDLLRRLDAAEAELAAMR